MIDLIAKILGINELSPLEKENIFLRELLINLGEDPEHPTIRFIPYKKDSPRLESTRLSYTKKKRLLKIVKKEQDNLIKELKIDPFRYIKTRYIKRITPTDLKDVMNNIKEDVIRKLRGVARRDINGHYDENFLYGGLYADTYTKFMNNFDEIEKVLDDRNRPKNIEHEIESLKKHYWKIIDDLEKRNIEKDPFDR